MAQSTVFITVFLLANMAARIWAATNTVESDKLTFQYDNIRLPGNVLPLKYSIYLHPNITDGRFFFTGMVSITIEVKEETDSIILHSLRLNHILTTVVELPDTKTEAGEFGKEITVIRTTKHVKHEQAIIQLATTLSKRMKYMLTIYFSGEMRIGLSGLYLSTYKTKSGEKKYIATTQFEATGARLAFPCFDEPAMKAKFKISIVREKIHTALSNMPIETEDHRGDGLIVDNFQESVKMSTYLVAFVISDFKKLNTTSKKGIKVNVWAPKDVIPQAKYALEIVTKILDYYEEFFKINFPLPKQDLVAIPDLNAYAMENWGLVTYTSSALLYDEKETSSSDKQIIAATIAHEMAHQWFGNLVTMKWWDDLWLNEGFATFMETVGTHRVSPELKIMDQFVISDVQAALALDSHLNSHPMLVTAKTPAEINALFDTISYMKGGSIIRMMIDFIGHDHFINGISNYLNTYKYGTATSDDLWKTLSKEIGHIGINVKTVMDTWTYQKGYPVINVRRDGDEAHLTQARFITDVKDTNNNNTSSNYKWNIPLTFYYQHAKDKKRKWFHVFQKNVSIPWNHDLGWLKLNVDQIGFYRVNYNEQNWKALAMQLKKDHNVFSSTDRANLIDDAFQLANIGKVTQTQALELTEYLNKEVDYVPFACATLSLRYIGDMLLSRTGYAAYEKYILYQVLPHVKTLGWNDEGKELDKYLRGIVLKLAVNHNNSNAVEKAKVMFDHWMIYGKAIPVNLRPIVYYAGARYGGEKEWNFLYNQYLKCLYPSEKQLLMYSLAYTSNSKLLKNYLELTLNRDVIGEADACYVMMEITLNPIGREITYEFLKKRWNIIIKRYPMQLPGLLAYVFSGGKTKDDLHKAKEFFDTHDIGSAKLAANQTLVSIRNNIKWLESNEKTVVKWLNTQIKI